MCPAESSQDLWGKQWALKFFIVANHMLFPTDSLCQGDSEPYHYRVSADQTFGGQCNDWLGKNGLKTAVGWVFELLAVGYQTGWW
jgi:hypothetical protein